MSTGHDDSIERSVKRPVMFPGLRRDKEEKANAGFERRQAAFIAGSSFPECVEDGCHRTVVFGRHCPRHR